MKTFFYLDTDLDLFLRYRKSSEQLEQLNKRYTVLGPEICGVRIQRWSPLSEMFCRLNSRAEWWFWKRS